MPHSSRWNSVVIVRACAALALTISPARAADPDGTVRTYFSQPAATAKVIRAAVLDSSGRVVAAGSSANTAFRLNLDGTLDTGFAANTFNAKLTSILQQADGRILVSGLYTLTNSQFRPYVVRLDTSGVIDTTFPATPIGGTGVQVMVPGMGGKFYLGKVNGYGLQRYDASGTSDNTFLSPTLGFGQINGVVSAVRELVDGKVLVAHVTSDNSTFGTINGYHLDRVSSTGEIDPTFTPPALDHRISGFDVLPDNRIAIIGEFTTVNGSPHAGVAILGENGALDGTFNTTLDTAAPSSPRFGVRYLDGRIFIHGDFNQVNGQPLSGFARLQMDGSIDPGYTTGTDVGRRVDSLLVAPSGDLFLGGSFSTINSVQRYYAAYLARSTGTPPPDTLADYLSSHGVPAGMRGPLDDPDRDGLSNLIEYALGLDPSHADGSPFVLAPSAGNLTLTYVRAQSDVTYTVQTSADLADPNSWTSVGVNQGSAGPGGSTTASIPIGPTARFLRLNVTR